MEAMYDILWYNNMVMRIYKWDVAVELKCVLEKICHNFKNLGKLYIALL